MRQYLMFRDRARELGHPDPESLCDMDVWLYIIKHQPPKGDS